MASSRNGSGMKILWIPGRKKHDRKGLYSSTSKVSLIYSQSESADDFMTPIMISGSQQELLTAKEEPSLGTWWQFTAKAD